MKIKNSVEALLEITGGLCSAALASICCWGPVVLAAFGLGSGALAQFTAYRWGFILLAFIFLSRSLYLAYKAQSKRNIIIILVIIFIAVFFILLPFAL
ncbi:hypothetical protein HZC34_00795 [Candidatus Saganbacteria bacterium]|nr:hypothetical protein [Candidatus Saganbacteria bacterium]